MLRGLYTATAGMASEMSSIELLTNNVANANTIGYKQDFDALLRQAAGPSSYGEGGLVRGTGMLSVKTSVDVVQGTLHTTSNPYDLALQGVGMFGLQVPGGVAYTRNGRFSLSASGQLTTEGGNVVLDANGRPLQLPDPKGQPVTIKGDGTILEGGTIVGKIGVFNAPNWAKVGNALYTPISGTATAITTNDIKQGELEEGNVDLAQTMTAIMSAERSYEAASQFQRTQDQVLQQSVNDLGRLQ
jgi:flagellar basal body rod protein FlgG